MNERPLLPLPTESTEHLPLPQLPQQPAQRHHSKSDCGNCHLIDHNPPGSFRSDICLPKGTPQSEFGTASSASFWCRLAARLAAVEIQVSET